VTINKLASWRFLIYTSAFFSSSKYYRGTHQPAFFEQFLLDVVIRMQWKSQTISKCKTHPTFILQVRSLHCHNKSTSLFFFFNLLRPKHASNVQLSWKPIDAGVQQVKGKILIDLTAASILLELPRETLWVTKPCMFPFLNFVVLI